MPAPEDHQSTERSEGRLEHVGTLGMAPDTPKVSIWESWICGKLEDSNCQPSILDLLTSLNRFKNMVSTYSNYLGLLGHVCRQAGQGPVKFREEARKKRDETRQLNTLSISEVIQNKTHIDTTCSTAINPSKHLEIYIYISYIILLVSHCKRQTNRTEPLVPSENG